MQVSWYFSFYNISKLTLYLNIILPVMMSSRKYTVIYLFNHWENNLNAIRFCHIVINHSTTEDTRFPADYFITGISGQISMLNCSTCSISTGTRQTTSFSLLLLNIPSTPPPPPHPPQLCTLSVFVSKQDECLSLSHSRALIFYSKHWPLSFLALFSRVCKTRLLITEKPTFNYKTVAS